MLRQLSARHLPGHRDYFKDYGDMHNLCHRNPHFFSIDLNWGNKRWIAQKSGIFLGILASLSLPLLGLCLMSCGKKHKLSAWCFLLWLHFPKAWASNLEEHRVEKVTSRLGKEWRSLGCRGTAFCSLTEPLEGITTRDIERGQFWVTKTSPKYPCQGWHHRIRMASPVESL